MMCFLYAVGETFGKLPSEVLRNADTFDMQVYDIVQTLREHERKKSSGDSVTDSYSQEDLLNILERTKK